MTALVFGILAFLATTMIVAGLFGRPDERYPRCRACNADARPYAWDDPPRCACNADLSRPGSVRTRGRLRRPRLVVVGLVLLIMTVAVGAPIHQAIARGEGPAANAPLSVLEIGIDQGWDWAVREATERARRDEIEPASAAALWRIVHRRLASAATANELLGAALDPLRTVWERDPVVGSQVLIEALAVNVVLAGEFAPAEPRVVRRGETASLHLHVASDVRNGRGHAFLRLSDVRIGDRRLDPALERVLGRPTRVVRWTSVLPLVIPDDAPLGETTLEVELVAALSPAAAVAPGDPLIDSDAPPSKWGIRVVAAPHRVQIPVRVEKADERVAEP